MYDDHRDVCATFIIVTAGSAASLLNSLVPVIKLFIASLLIMIFGLMSLILTNFVCDVEMLSNSQLLFENEVPFCKNTCNVKFARVLLFLIGHVIIA